MGKALCPNAIDSKIWCETFYKASNKAIHVWCKKFACERENVVDEKRPGRCVVSTTDPAIAAVTSYIWSDRHVSISVQINGRYAEKNKMLMYDI